MTKFPSFYPLPYFSNQSKPEIKPANYPKQFGIVIDEKREEDISIFLDDDKVLIIEDSVAEGVDNQKDGDEDSILDFVESPEGTRFTLS